LEGGGELRGGECWYLIIRGVASWIAGLPDVAEDLVIIGEMNEMNKGMGGWEGGVVVGINRHEIRSRERIFYVFFPTTLFHHQALGIVAPISCLFPPLKI